MKRQSTTIAVLLFSLFALVLAFQNCSKPTFSSGSPGSTKLTDNGGPYGGKLGEYRHFDSTGPCSTLDLKGKPLPNDMVLIKLNEQGTRAPFLARESCQDIPPVAIAPEEVKFDEATMTLTYKDKSFASNERPGDFDIVSPKCPAGKTPIAGAVLKNSAAAANDWTYRQTYQNGFWTPGWYSSDGTNVGLFSTISSLPAYVVQRTDGALLDNWRRVSQSLIMKASTEYSFTFLAQPGSVQAADFTFYRGWTGVAGDPRNEEAIITFNFLTNATSTVRITNVAGVSAEMSPFANGYVGRVYFTTSAAGDQTDSSVGLAPSTFGQYSGAVGDSIVATSAQLVPVDDFCQ